jgi:hypothetical protein
VKLSPFFYKTTIMLFQSLKKASDNIVKNLSKEADKAIDNNLSTMRDLNVEQMEQGLNSDGKQIGLLRSEPYARAKKATGGVAPFGIPDLKLTGDFHAGTFAKKQGQSLQFGSTDSKTGELTSKYGKEIFGLTDKNKTTTTDQILAETLDYVTTQIQMI